MSKKTPKVQPQPQAPKSPGKAAKMGHTQSAPSGAAPTYWCSAGNTHDNARMIWVEYVSPTGRRTTRLRCEKCGRTVARDQIDTAFPPKPIVLAEAKPYPVVARTKPLPPPAKPVIIDTAEAPAVILGG